MVEVPAGGSEPPAAPDHDENDPGTGRHGAGVAGSSRRDTDQHDTDQHDTDQHDTDQHDTDQHDTGPIDEITETTPSDEIDAEEELVAYGDSPGAGALGLIDDLPEPNEPG